MLRVHLLRGLERAASQPALEIGRQVERELGLRAIALENLFDRLHLGKGRVEHLRADAARERFGPHLGQPCLERLWGRSRRIWRLRRARTREEEDRDECREPQHRSHSTGLLAELLEKWRPALASRADSIRRRLPPEGGVFLRDPRELRALNDVMSSEEVHVDWSHRSRLAPPAVAGSINASEASMTIARLTRTAAIPGLVSAMTAAAAEHQDWRYRLRRRRSSGNSRDRCDCSIAGMHACGEEQVQAQGHRGGRERQDGQEQLRSERRAKGGADHPREDGGHHIDDRDGALVELPPPQPSALVHHAAGASGVPGCALQLSQIVEHLIGRRVAFGRRDPEAFADDRRRAPAIGQLPRQRGGTSLHHPREHEGRVRSKRMLAGRELPGDHAEREQVGARVDLAAA